MSHLQREQEGRALYHHADMGQDAQGETGLPHAGTSPDDRQRRGLQTEQDLVELVIARGHPGDGRAALAELLDAVQTLEEQFVER